MVVIDYLLGEKAEYLNAYSVLERLLGKEPSVSESMVARQYGASGELAAVLITGLLIGLIFTLLARARRRNAKDVG